LVNKFSILEAIVLQCLIVFILLACSPSELVEVLAEV
jgi:nitric oxide reductase large subunit